MLPFLSFSFLPKWASYFWEENQASVASLTDINKGMQLMPCLTYSLVTHVLLSEPVTIFWFVCASGDISVLCGGLYLPRWYVTPYKVEEGG